MFRSQIKIKGIFTAEKQEAQWVEHVKETLNQPDLETT